MINAKLQFLFVDKDKDQEGVIYTAFAALLKNEGIKINSANIDTYVNKLNKDVIIDWDFCKNIINAYFSGISTDLQSGRHVNLETSSIFDIVGINPQFIKIMNFVSTEEELFKDAYSKLRQSMRF